MNTGGTTIDAHHTVELHEVIGPELVERWDALARSTGARFAARPSYGLSWFRTLGRGHLAVATAHRGDELVAVLPLHVRDRLGVPEYRLLGHGLGTIGDVPTRDAEALDPLVAGLHRAGVNLVLTHLPVDAPLRAAIRRHGGWHTDFRVDDFCPVIDLPEGSTAADLRGSSSLRRLRRAGREMAKRGTPLEFEFVDSPDGFRRRWPDIVGTAAEAAAAESEPRLNLCASPHDEFTRAFLAEEAERGGLAVWGELAGGRWCAHFVALRSGTRVEAWLTRYTSEVASARPGHQLLREICDTHSLQGFSEFDFLIGRNRYKSEWQTGGYEVGTLRASPRRSPGSRLWLRAVDRSGSAARAGVAGARGAARAAGTAVRG